MIMRTALIALVLAAGLAAGYDGRPVSVSLTDRPVYELFETLKTQGGLTIVYSRERLTKGGVPITINLDLKEVPAELVLEVATQAAGFRIEKKGTIFVVLPVRDESALAAPAAAVVPVPAAPVSVAAPAPESTGSGSGSVEVIGGDVPAQHEVTEKRYTGTFMFGHGDDIYLNLVIPIVNHAEEKRISEDMRSASADGVMAPKEAALLFGRESELKGAKLDTYLKALGLAVAEALIDGRLDATEINKLRNDFINTIVEKYERM